MRIKKCEICNKNIIISPNYLYKLSKNGKVKYYCSYTCWRKDGGGNGPQRIR